MRHAPRNGLRLFLALRPPETIFRQTRLLQHGFLGARWQTEDQQHITLRFIGDVTPHQAEDIASSLDGLVANPFTIRLAGVGHFAQRGRLNAIWAGVEPRDAITTLHQKLDRAMVRAGLPPEGRAFVPHLTLARFAASTPDMAATDWLAQHAGFVSEAFMVDAVILFESLLGKGGACYEEAARWPLGA